MGNITFEQLPQAVSTLIERVEQLAGKVDEVLGKAAGKDTGKRSLLSLEDVAALLGKSASTIYAMTSEKRIPYRKRGNKLYFFKKELIEWIQSGGAYDKPYTLSEQEQAEFDAHLEQMREKKRHKPAAIQQQ